MYILLLIGEDGMLRNESITSFTILSRAEFPGYAKQNNLVPGTWIDIHFDADRTYCNYWKNNKYRRGSD